MNNIHTLPSFKVYSAARKTQNMTVLKAVSTGCSGSTLCGVSDLVPPDVTACYSRDLSNKCSSLTWRMCVSFEFALTT